MLKKEKIIAIFFLVGYIILTLIPNKTIAKTYSRANATSNQNAGIQQITFKGWKNAYRLYNNDAEAIIVPNIGRMMSFRLLNSNNVLNINNDNTGKIPSPNRKKYTFFGGFYTWLAPQSSNTPWPPNYEFDIGPYKIIHKGKRELIMLSPIVKSFGLQVEKRFKLSEKNAILSVRIRLYNRTNILLRWSAWNLTAVKPTGIAFFDLPEMQNPYDSFHYEGTEGKKRAKEHFNRIIHIITEQQTSSKNTHRCAAVDLRQYKWKGEKLFVHPHSKFLAYHLPGNWFIRTFSASGSFGDYNTQVQLWADLKRENIFELEVVAPDKIIPPQKYIDWNEQMIIISDNNEVDSNYEQQAIKLKIILNQLTRLLGQVKSKK